MLDWAHLTKGQRASTAFVALFVMIGAFFSLFSVMNGQATLRDVLAGIAVYGLMLGTALNPGAVRGQLSSLQIATAPSACRWLYTLAAAALLVRGLLGASGQA